MKEKSITIKITKDIDGNGVHCFNISCKEWKCSYYTRHPDHEAYTLIKEILDSEFFDD